MPKECSYKNAQAWDVWSTLDAHGRMIDTMAGYAMPLRIEAINEECSRYGDSDDIRWRVLFIDKEIVKHRREKSKK